MSIIDGASADTSPENYRQMAIFMIAKRVIAM